MLTGGAGLLALDCGPGPAEERVPDAVYDATKHRYAFIVDIEQCIGCCDCMRACREENDVPGGQYRTWIERYRIDERGEVHVDVAKDEKGFAPAPGKTRAAFFVPKLCNHCEDTPCTQVCPVGASFQTADGVVLIDNERCIGCGYCVQACPYGTRFMHMDGHVASKCTLCYHRITKGKQPACVEACPTDARAFGDLNDPDSPIARRLAAQPHRKLRPELGTEPRVHYRGLSKWVV